MGRDGAKRPRRGTRWMSIFVTIKRVALLIAVWACAVLVCMQAVRAFQHRQSVACEVRNLNQQYDDTLQVYAGELAVGDKLESSAEYQKDLLKKHFGYTERNETPIMVLPYTSETK